MTATTKLAGFAAVLAVAFGGAALAGAAIDPDRSTQSQPAGHSAMPTDAHAVRGLAVADDDLRLVVDDTELRRGARERLGFRVVDSDGATVRDFDVTHERRLHLIVVRRDLTGFQHLHPVQAADGSWSAPLRPARPGSYRMFADFSHDGEPHTLATDLRVGGDARLHDLPAPAASTTTDGYEVRLDPDELRFTITRGGRPVQVQPYLGAGGHLVVLREGDLAFLHVHPDDGLSTSFESDFPSAGRYRLFLQFKHEGRVHTAAFTREVS